MIMLTDRENALVREVVGPLPKNDLLQRLLDEHAELRNEDRRWGERIKLLERRARFAELILSGHADHLLPEYP